jgi:uncharacterized repeat protein (TIGR03803 family)
MHTSSVKFGIIAGLAACLFFLVSSNCALASTETVLYTFKGTPDGSAPSSELVRDKEGNFYGATSAGGVSRLGTVFEVSRSSSGVWTETVLHSFGDGNDDGVVPSGGLTIDANGNLYGTTMSGGSAGFGTLYELSRSSGNAWTEKILFNFSGGSDGGDPGTGSLVFDPKGNVYGTTQNGGTYGYGVAFELSPSSSGDWTEKVIHDFAETATDGGYPVSVVFDAAGNLYGPAAQGGSFGRGVVFELSPSAGGEWTETILHNFADDSTDGGLPTAGVVFHGGALYGTTEYGGSNSLGTAYQLSSTKAGWKETILHSFANNGIDGFAPESTVAFDKAGNLYATTYGGGTKGFGTVFELTRSGNKWVENIVYEFTGESDGGYLYYGVIVDAKSNLYGVTYGGGNGSAGSGAGNGVVFEITP